MKLSEILLIAGALCALAITYLRGYSTGQAELRAKHHEQTITALTAGLDEYRDALAQSQTAIEASAVVSQQARTVLAAAEKTNRSTTNDLRQLLADTAADRVGCRFDDRSMQQLGTARDRAAAAATGTAPAALMQRCSPPPETPAPEVDAVMLALKEMYDAYGLCAWQHSHLIDWLEQAP